MTRTLLLLLFLVLASSARTQGVSDLRPESVPEPAADEPARPPEMSERMLRDPFWPVGYRPRAGQTPAPSRGPAPAKSGDPVHFSSLTPEEQAMIRSSMVVGGVLRLGNAYIAYINHSVVRAGELLTLNAGGRTYVFLVKSISENRVELEPHMPDAGGSSPSPNTEN